MLLIRKPWRSSENEALEAPPPRSRLTARAAADWPRTTRLLPWSVAGLIAMIWLTPFDQIQLSVGGPINITLDRIVLPIVAAIWLIALAAGAGVQPRVRITRVHAALAAFVACALLSVVLDARYLNHTGDLMLSIKKLPLLISYLSIFVIVASSVRRTEVPAFMTYSLVLAVICGVEIIYEYHYHQNLFVTWTERLLPRPFELMAGAGNVSAADSLGRLSIAGPTDYGVEVVVMMSMVLPIAIFGILDTKARLRHVAYSLALVVVVSAMFATQRKSALVIPAATILTLAYFRRRELISLAPLGLVVAVIVALVSPGVIHGVLAQFTSANSTHVATVSDRTADYDAVRPDLWTHILFGRGYGSFDPHTYRVLDSEILGPIVDMGVLGLLAYLLIGVSVVLVGRKMVSRRDPRWSPPALCGVAAAVCMLAASFLYDFWGFPHGTYTFLYVAGLAVAVVRPGIRPATRTPVPPNHESRAHARLRRSAREAARRGVPTHGSA